MLLIPGTRLGVAGSKSGVLYVVNLDDMGGLTNSTSVNDNVVQTFVVGKTSPERIAGSPVFWKGPDRSYVYVWGENDHVKAYPFLGASYTPGVAVLDTANVVENDAIDAPQDPGAMLAVSANGSAAGTGIVWASHTWSGDANQQVQPGVLRAFDATTLTELWNSQPEPRPRRLRQVRQVLLPDDRERQDLPRQLLEPGVRVRSVELKRKPGLTHRRNAAPESRRIGPRPFAFIS